MVDCFCCSNLYGFSTTDSTVNSPVSAPWTAPIRHLDKEKGTGRLAMKGTQMLKGKRKEDFYQIANQHW
jgi:hypothetical protein